MKKREKEKRQEEGNGGGEGRLENSKRKKAVKEIKGIQEESVNDKY